MPTPTGTGYGATNPVFAPVGFWWAIYLLFNLVATVGGRMALSEDINALIASDYVDMIADVAGIIAAALCCAVVITITKNQEIKYEQVRSAK